MRLKYDNTRIKYDNMRLKYDNMRFNMNKSNPYQRHTLTCFSKRSSAGRYTGPKNEKHFKMKEISINLKYSLLVNSLFL